MNLESMDHLEQRLRPLYEQLAAHAIYAEMQTLDDLHFFMEAHVYAVWDFMSLLKALQRTLTCVEIPWRPSRLAESRRLVNEIVLGEESDVYEGRSLSHFELYLLAMRQAGADTAGIDGLLDALGRGEGLESILTACPNLPAAGFMRDTFAVIGTGRPHAVAAAFTFGREDLIPEIFRGFVQRLDSQAEGRLETFLWYLRRHIEVDGEEHGPMARRMVAELCGDDRRKWTEAEDAAAAAVESRLRLWDGVLAAMRSRKLQPA